MMHIDSPRFGALEVEPSKIIEFPRGLPGFEDLKRFTLLHPDEQANALPSYFILQSVDDPAVAFHIADPARFGFNYEITLSDDDAAMIRLADPVAAAVVVMLVNEGGGVRANLNAPLVLNLEARLGVQHVFARLNYAVTLKDNSS
ncbi:MAG: flagellar assembly protein FliW [Sulfurisoma sp.]|nr:flagellar assembly protein FliW [Sulfurisoma sp.]